MFKYAENKLLNWMLRLVELNDLLATHRLFTLLALVPQPHPAGSHLEI